MFKIAPSTIPPTKTLLILAGHNYVSHCAVLVLTYSLLANAPAVRATNSDGDTGANPNASPLTLVFSDDFSSDPNSNRQWTVHRYAGQPSQEAAWDKPSRAWALTRGVANRAAAVFANYELTATTWRAEFRYRAYDLGGLQNGGDGFVFMFYKNKSAYGTPAFGYQKGFDLSNGTEVKGYGLQFDNYIEGCDPSPTDYYALIKDDVCSFLGGQQFDWIGDNNWHQVQVAFADGGIRITIDGGTTFDTQLEDPDSLIQRNRV